jgi:hypothetical protein
MSGRSRNPIVAFLGSYGLACALLFFLFVLTLLGTLAQTSEGLYSVQKKYFESWFLLQPVGPLKIPLPGGALCMGLLAVNLAFGGLVRIRKTAATAGILVVHIGMVVMLLAAVVKWQMSEDGFLRLFEGQQSDSWMSWHDWEVAVWDADDKEDVRELLIPDDLFKDLDETSRRTFTSPELPFDIVLSCYTVNSTVLPKGPMWEAYGPEIEGYAIRSKEPDSENTRNMPAVHVEIVGEDGSSRSGILWGRERGPLVVEEGGNRYALTLRKEDHPGMTMAAAFESDVTQITGSTEREVLIEMNEPLRDGGLVLFQSSWGPSDAAPGEPLFSVFSVARNPSDQWPLISCIIIAIGLLWAFGRRLLNYIRAQKPAREATGSSA